MKKINLKILVYTSLICLLPIVLGVFFYNQLPMQVAIHFDVNNNPDGFFSKSGFVFGMPLLMVILQVFCCITNDLSDKNQEANKKATRAYKWIIPILANVFYIVTIMYALGNTIDIRKVAMIILGIIFIVIGNYSPKTKGKINGLKSVNEDEYKKLSRILGYLFIINGLLCFISILFNQYVSVAVVSIVILEAIVFYIYSFNKTKK